MTQQTLHLETLAENGRRQWLVASVASAIVAAAFTLAVVGVMFVTFLREQSASPLTDGTMTRLKAQLLEQPADEALKSQIRQADLLVREDFFRRRDFLKRGGWLVLFGAAAFAIATKFAFQLSARPYLPSIDAPPPNPTRVAAVARLGIVGFSVVVAASLTGLALFPRYKLPTFVEPPVIETEAPLEMVLKNWPSFRGPGGSGVAVGEYPTQWDAASGQNILWKAEVPLAGFNSPVIWDDRVFLTGAAADQRELYCFDANTGSLKWKQPYAGSTPKDLSEATGYAPATVATDGHRVYVISLSCELTAFDFDGRQMWVRSLGTPQNSYGHSSSLLAYRSRVIVQLDQGGADDRDKSALLCFDGASGRPLWQTKRPVGASWATPILAHTTHGAQVIAAADPWLMGYDAETGAELWRAKLLRGEVAPSPVFVNDVVYAGNERADLVAVKTDGTGDVSKSVLWKYPDDLPDITSPLVTGQRVFMVTTSGMLTCVDAASGQMAWQQEMDGEFNSSPALAGGRVYVTDAKGVTHVIDASGPFKEISTGSVGEPVRASMAFVDGKIYIRGEKNLYCVGSKR